MHAAGGATRRLFVAVPLPVELVSFAIRAQELLPPDPAIRLLSAEQLHFTLAFIGGADASRAEAARAVVQAVPVDGGGEALIDGFLLLPSAGRARVIALAAKDLSGVFERLFDVVMGGLEAAGVITRHNRPFRAHATVARVAKPKAVQPTSDCGRARFRVESVCLYESELRREGARYTVLARTDLNRADGQETA
jgi:2'-5' RNA ligase